MTEKTSETEVRILEAAHRVFLRRGTHGARMQEIAEEAGVNQALLHYYFRSKERLSAAVFQKAVGAFLPRIAEMLGSDASVEDKVGVVVEVELSFFKENPYLPGYLIGELNQNADRVGEMLDMMGMQQMRVVLQKLDAQLEARAREGTLRSISAREFVVNLFSLCIFPFAARPMLRLVLGIDNDAFGAFIEERKRTLPAFFLNALRP